MPDLLVNLVKLPALEDVQEFTVRRAQPFPPAEQLAGHQVDGNQLRPHRFQDRRLLGEEGGHLGGDGLPESLGERVVGVEDGLAGCGRLSGYHVLSLRRRQTGHVT